MVKGVNFLDVQDVSDPVRLADYYSRSGADELVFYDITASVEGRKLFTDILTDVASTIFIPLTVGGGISRLEDFERVLSCGCLLYTSPLRPKDSRMEAVTDSCRSASQLALFRASAPAWAIPSFRGA